MLPIAELEFERIAIVIAIQICAAIRTVVAGQPNRIFAARTVPTPTLVGSGPSFQPEGHGNKNESEQHNQTSNEHDQLHSYFANSLARQQASGTAVDTASVVSKT